jgi:hypothetical protein
LPGRRWGAERIAGNSVVAALVRGYADTELRRNSATALGRRRGEPSVRGVEQMQTGDVKYGVGYCATTPPQGPRGVVRRIALTVVGEAT